MIRRIDPTELDEALEVLNVAERDAAEAALRYESAKTVRDAAKARYHRLLSLKHLEEGLSA